MGIAVTIKIDEAGVLKRKMEKLKELVVVHTLQAARDFLEYFNATWQKRKHRGRPGIMPRRGQGGGLLSSRQLLVTGNSVATMRGAWTIGGERNPYARIHELGGVITASKTKYLAIPLDAVKTAAGVTRLPRPREYENTFLKKVATGFLIMQAQEDGTVKALFKLQKSVTIPARLGVREVFMSTSMTVARKKLFARALRRAEKEAMAG